MDGIESAAIVNREKPVPVILVSAHYDAELLGRAGADPVMAYLIKPVKPADLEAAIAVAVLFVERAKGVVEKRLRMDEPEAFRRLRKLACDQNRKLVEVAHEILVADASFQVLEKS